METTESPIVAGVFRDRSIANHAVDELRHAGFRSDQIHVWGQGTTTGGMLDALMSSLSGHTNERNLYQTLVEQGMTGEDATYYQQELETDRTIITVQSYGHQQEAHDILYRFGAYDANTDVSRVEPVHTIQLREEVLQPLKHSVEVGEVIIRKVVVTEEKTITVSIRREELVIERRAISPDALPGQPQHSEDSARLNGKVIEIGEGETIRIPLRTEQIVIEKRPIITEELLVGKRKLQEIQHFSDTVKREEAHIEHTGEVNIRESQAER